MGSFTVILVVIWLGSVGVWWVVSRAARSADVDRIKTRLLGTGKQKKSQTGKPRQSLIQQDAQGGKVVQKILRRYELLPKIQNLLEQAGLRWNPVRLIHACLGMFLAAFGLAWFTLPGQFRQLAFLAGLIGSVIPIVYVSKKRTARMRRFEELFPDSLEFVSRSMRAGHAFSVSLEMLHREFQEPLAGEFRRTFEEHNLGLPLEVALQKLAKRVPSLDVHFFVSAVLLQKRTGGNLAEILDKLAYVIRERFKLRGRIRAISAHGRMTGAALSLIPLSVAVLMFYTNPEYVKFFFTDETGNYMLGGSVLLQAIGYGIIRKIVSIEV
ncbi:MAG: type II secretion system F family protein [Bryobacteraceae bacterium]